MRLINSSTLRLETRTSKIPPYAILSHTWGSDTDEVTFQEINNPNSQTRAKKGFKKIRLCAQQAAKDGIQYCWVDTCCIDKSSSAELSEAINSMFSWYAKSKVCYIFLDDVDASSGLDYQLTKTRWFTRGWTLQELIAPENREFYDRNWRLIGKVSNDGGRSFSLKNGFATEFYDQPGWDRNDESRQAIIQAIITVAGIDIELLLTGKWRDCCVGTKMSWVASRQTTKEEDMTYCLLGIFDINMPLLYGEGGKAFIRLQEEIMKKKVDHTIFAWQWEEGGSSPFTFNGLLSPSPRFFKSLSFETALRSAGRNMSSYEMTNSGLRIQLPLIPIKGKDDEYRAVLDVESFGQLFTIRLRKINSHGQFARVDVEEGCCHRIRFAVETAKMTWIHVQQFIDQVNATPSYDRLSRIILRSDFGGLHWRGITTSNSFNQEELSFDYEGRPIKAKVVLMAISSREPNRGITWTIEAEEPKPITSRFQGNSWQSTVSVDTEDVGSEVTFHVLRGELVAIITLKTVPKEPPEDAEPAVIPEDEHVSAGLIFGGSRFFEAWNSSAADHFDSTMQDATAGDTSSLDLDADLPSRFRSNLESVSKNETALGGPRP